MKREIDRLSDRTFDLLVVGGGVYGLTIAYDAAQRGMDVALVERNDFGSGASFNHLRTIHGGLRYLQTLDLGRARESLRERRTMALIAPHLIRPLSFVLPLSRSLTRGTTAMRVGFALDRLVGLDRNRGVPTELRLDGGRVIGRAEALRVFQRRFPTARPSRLTGAAIWQDYVTVEADRLTLAWALAAASHGARLANYVEAIALLVDGPRVVGVRAVDRQNGPGLEISARVTVNATGSAIDRLRTLSGVGGVSRGTSMRPIPMIRAMNLVTRRDAGEVALGGRAASGRNLFMVPWRGRELFGTWESGRTCDPGDTSIAQVDLTAFVADLNEAFPDFKLTLNDVSLVHRGLVPASVSANGRVALEGHEQIRDDGEGFVSVAGTKYTTARAVAQRVVDIVLKKHGRTASRSIGPCRTAKTPLPGGDLSDVGAALVDAQREHAATLQSDTIAHLVAAHGSGYRRIVELASDRAALRARLADDSPVIGAQLVWAVREEMAMTLADAVIRRTPIGALGDPGAVLIARAAAIVGAESGWSEERMRTESRDVTRFYRWPD